MYVQLNCVIIDGDANNRQELSNFLGAFGVNLVGQLANFDTLPQLLSRSEPPQLVIINLDPRWAQSGWVELPIDKFGITGRKPFQVHDQLTGTRYLWNGPRNFVKLDPAKQVAHVFRIRKYQRTEKNFDYYL